MTVAVTGSTGHLAASVIPLLADRDYHVKALYREQEPFFNLTSLETVKGSLSDKVSLEKLVHGCEVTIHCAARISLNSNHDPSVYETNVNGTINIFNVAERAGVKRFIYISSIHAYNSMPTNEFLDEKREYCSDNAPVYDQSKRDAEQYVLHRTDTQMEVLVLNPTAIVGPFDYKPSLIGKAFMDIYNNKVPSLIDGGFDFCDVRDVAQGIVNAIDKGRNGHSYLLSGKWYSLAEIHEIIMDVKGDKRHIPVLPAWTGYLGLPFISLLAAVNRREPFYTKESLFTLIHSNKKINSAKAAEELGYKCRPLYDTIKDSINSFKQTGYLI
jgi:dihydroflavonol-4-reductase